MSFSVPNSLKEWLLEPEDRDTRHLAMRYLFNTGSHDLALACKDAHSRGRIGFILDKMHKDGYWVKPGAGYSSKYTGSVWSIILLSQLGASINMDERIEVASRYLVDHAMTQNGQFSINGTPSATIDCLQGNLCAAFLDMGFPTSSLAPAFEWMARSVTGEGVAPMEEKTAALRYYAGKRGPNFCCGANSKLPCAWGAVKVMLAFSRLPLQSRTPLINKAITRGVEFLLGTDPADASYPCGYADKPSGNWWKFGFAVFYVTDLLQNVEALAGLGYGHDPRLSNAIRIIKDKQTADGAWLLEYDYTGKTWLDFGRKKLPSKSVTLRALKVLKMVEETAGL